MKWVYAIFLIAFFFIGMLADRVIFLDNKIDIVSSCDYTAADVQDAYLIAMNNSKEQFKDEMMKYLHDCNSRMMAAYSYGIDRCLENEN